MPLPRARSPVKTSLNSPAQRNRLIGRNSNSSPRESNSQPASTNRRLDFKSQEAKGPRSNSQPITGKGIPKLSAVNGSARASANGYHSYRPEESEEEVVEEEEEEEESTNWNADNGDEEEVDNFVEESMAMLSAEAEESPEPEEDAGESSAEEETARAAAARRKPAPALKQRGGGRPPKTSKPSPLSKVAKGRRVVEEEESDEAAEEESAQEDEPEAVEEVEEEAPTSEEEEEEEAVIPKPKPKGKVGKRKAPTPEPEPRPKKRRSLNEVEAENDTGHQAKRQRAEPASAPAPAPAPKSRGRPPKKPVSPVSEEEEQPKAPAPKASAPKKASKAPAPPPAAEKAKRGRKRKSSLPGDTSQVIVPRGPPLPRSRGLMINRREVPGNSDSMTQTRSGRNSFKPLAYWRNERVDYDPEEATDDLFGTKTHAGKFLLPSIKEVVRVDEPEPVYPTKSRKGKRGAKARGRPSKSRGGYDSEEDDGPPAEPWESDPGQVEGHVITWQPDHEFNPPAQDEFVDVHDRTLAISSAAVQTQTVKDASFRYAKILSEGFFNAGVVDLPPGSEKRPKNSRKMFMTFFVHTGRVLVTVNETTFRISKGGMWFVPRGKHPTNPASRT